jgi:hypothetical protein
VAASATSAPPVIRPPPSALVASTLRRRIDMGGSFFRYRPIGRLPVLGASCTVRLEPVVRLIKGWVRRTKRKKTRRPRAPIGAGT